MQRTEKLSAFSGPTLSWCLLVWLCWCDWEERGLVMSYMGPSINKALQSRPQTAGPAGPSNTFRPRNIILLPVATVAIKELHHLYTLLSPPPLYFCLLSSDTRYEIPLFIRTWQSISSREIMHCYHALPASISNNPQAYSRRKL